MANIVEYRARVGNYHAVAVLPLKRHRLAFHDILLANFIACFGCKAIPLMVICLVLKDTILIDYFLRISEKVTTAGEHVGPLSENHKDFDHLHFMYIDFISILLLISGSVHPNPGPSTVTQRDITLCHINCQSLLNKIDLIAVELGKFDIISISETWLDQTIDNSEILIPNYQEPIRLDRNRHGGGVAVYFNKQIPFVERTDLNIRNLEVLWAEIILNNKKVLLGTFYLHPRFDDWDLVCLSIDQALQLCPNLILLGDFNQNILDVTKSKNIRNVIRMFNLNQLIDSPTRITRVSSTLIDLALTTPSLHCTEKGVLDPFCSDHCPIFISTNFIQVRQPCYERKIWLYDRANYTLFREKLNVCDWTTDNLTVDQCVTQFANNILISADQAIPNKNVTIRPRDPPWMHNEIRKEIRLRKRLHRRAKSKNDDISWEAFKVQRNKVNNLVRSSKITHFKKLATSLQQGNLNPKQWWTVTKQFLKQNKESDISLLIQNNKHFTSPHEKSNVLNEYFCMQSTVDDSHATLPPIEIPEHSLDNIVISSQDVEDVLRLLDTSKASGPDLISPKLLKEGAPVLSPHFCKLFNKSIDECSFPSEWKLANIIPVYKKGDRTEASNYRPISLLSCVGKVFEKCVFKHLYNFLRTSDVITRVQSGFTPGDSAVYQLIDLYDTFCRALDDGKEVRVVFCDISKAFDRVWHRGLLFKMRQAGISNPLLRWFESYLSNRFQRVVLEGSVSDYRGISAGVPQGSILGPIMFLVYINDIVENINSCIRLFADDTSLYLIVDDPGASADPMNSDLEKIHTWSQNWLASFNPNKTGRIVNH